MSVAAQAGCRNETIESANYVICEFKASDGIELFLRDQQGAPLGQFGRVQDALAARRRTLLFAMNAGMYHEDRSPVGLYVENGQALKRLSTANGPGNFSMKPNGVFYVDGKSAGVLETGAFARRKLKPAFATQSGPMLVINGRLHPRFLANATSRNRRNGVGVAGSEGEVRAGRDARHFPRIRARVQGRLEDTQRALSRRLHLAPLRRRHPPQRHRISHGTDRCRFRSPPR